MPNAASDPVSGWRVVPLAREHAERLCRWRYEPPYDLYGWNSWEKMERLGIEFGDPELRERQYAAVVDEGGELMGFAQFFPVLGVTRLGIGLRPDLCGQGIGPAFVGLIAREALRRAPQDAVDLEVLTWNARAIRAYEKAGFAICDTYWKRTPTGDAEFHCMELQKSAL